MEFFETREKLTAPRSKRTAGHSTQGASSQAEKPLSVSQLTQIIDKAIKAGVPAEVLVKAEASNFKLHSGSGHAYFTLKDERACIDCVMFRDDARGLKFTPADGMELLACGRVAVYPARGRYQLYVTRLEPVGAGALELAFRQLCEKLEKEGLFAAERKKPLPAYPLRVALVSGADTAAMHDMLKVLRRFAWVKQLVCPVLVQGDGAAEQIARMIARLNADARREIDLILLGRGGGSLEDLWAFNVEGVARAIAASRIPIITGIGHEVDVSIADLVADYHAHTPTEAAQVAVGGWRGVAETLALSEARLARGVRGAFEQSNQRLGGIERHDFFRRPVLRIQQMQQVIDERQRSLLGSIERRLGELKLGLAAREARLQQRHPRHAARLTRQRLEFIAHRMEKGMRQSLIQRATAIDALAKRLDAVGPQQVLQRGYTLTLHKKGMTPVRAAAQLRPGDQIVTRFADGQVESTVDDARQLKLFE